MNSLLQLACSARIARSAWRVSLAVGTALNLINQGGVFLAGNDIDWFHSLLNYFVPYCVASHCAAKNEMAGKEDESNTGTQ
ncbi:MAG: hypothetical protein A3E79_10625 [Burkholderiales bacterium RIFCSPHIGHO2_12_FULL_61_11]|nr:MAG: hypothetical protein A3E79_10625 [Burkholderiales bacterium RIFCSPHIGHO2_12_FULL_61_11]